MTVLSDLTDRYLEFLLGACADTPGAQHRLLMRYSLHITYRTRASHLSDERTCLETISLEYDAKCAGLESTLFFEVRSKATRDQGEQR
jgi:hypothetical protein